MNWLSIFLFFLTTTHASDYSDTKRQLNESRQSAVSVISAGLSHNCEIVSDKVFCWGGNHYDQIGSGITGENQRSPREVPQLPPATMLATGSFHSCALVEKGNVYCWGRNTYRQLGVDANSSSRPQWIKDLPPMKAITAGDEFTCGLTPEGLVYCWGANQLKQLGTATTESFSLPLQVGSLKGVTQISAGGSHACALQKGKLYCWGYGFYGQLGNGTLISKTAPTQVSGLKLKAIQVSAGAAHTCAILEGGDVYCWGSNHDGQLGFSAEGRVSIPTKVPSIAHVIEVRLGLQHTCGLTEGNSLFCWGKNTYGQLGDGTTQNQTTPVLATKLNSIRAFTVGGRHTCAVEASFYTYCWGYGGSGQLGNTSDTYSHRPNLVY